MQQSWWHSWFRFLWVKPATAQESSTCCEMLKLITEQSKLGIAEWDLTTGSIQWSNSLERLYGLEQGTFWGTKEAFLSYVHPEDREDVATEIEQAITTSEGYTIEFRIITQQQEEIWLRSIGALLPDRNVLIETITDISREHEFRNALVKNEIRWRSIVREVADIIFQLNPDGKIVFVSEAAQRFLGYAPNRLVGENILSFIHAEDTYSVSKTLREWHTSTPRSSIEFRFSHSSSHWVYLEASGTWLDQEQPALGLLGLVVYARDITSRKQAEQSIAEFLSLLKTTLESTADGIIALERDGTISHFNQEFIRLWQIPDDLIAQRDDFRLVDFMQEQVDDPTSFVDRVRLEYQNPTAQHLNLIPLKDGRYIERFSKPKYRGATITGRVVSYRDITERKRIEKELDEKRSFLQSLIENIPGAIYRGKHSLDWEDIYISPAIADITGYPIEELSPLGPRTYGSLMHPDDRAQVYRTEATALEAKQPYELEYRLIHADGSIRWILERARGVYDENGEIMHVDGAIFDITDRKQAEEKLLSSEQLNQAIIRIISDQIFQVRADGTIVELKAANAANNSVEVNPVEPPTHLSQLWEGTIYEEQMHCIHDALRTKSLQTYEFSVESDGKPKCFKQAIITPYSDSEALIVIRDVINTLH